MEFYRSVLIPSFVSSHFVTQPEITLISDTKASGIWRLEETVYFKEDHLILGRNAGDRAIAAAYY